jgi:hypothetical protein
MQLRHNQDMKVRLTLDKDAHEFAAHCARVRGISLGAAISELVRKAQTAPAPKLDIRFSQDGFPMFPPTGRKITSEMVNKIEAEEYDPKRYR